MKVIIITNQEIGHNFYKVNRLVEEYSKQSIEVEIFKNNGTLAEIKNNEIIINLPKADFVIYCDKDVYLAKLLEKNGYRLLNGSEFNRTCDDKILTFIKCSNLGIKMPDTIAGPLVYYELNDWNFDFLDKVIEKLGLPMIVKKVHGSLGEGVYLVKTKEELIDLYKQIYRNPILFQKYIYSSFGKSYRILIIGGKVFGGFIRENFSDFRSNFGTLASGEKIKNFEKYATFAQEIADRLQIEYAGLDLLDDENGDPVLCEINSNAFFEEFEKITNQNVAKAIVDLTIKLVGKNE